MLSTLIIFLRFKPGLRQLMAAAVALLALAPAAALAQTVQLSGSVAMDAFSLPSYGDLPSNQGLPLEIWFKPRNHAALDRLLASQQDPASPDYHKWLTPDEYAGRFGISQDQFDRLSRWLAGAGFQVTGGSPAEGVIKFNGATPAIAHAFNTRIAKFSADGSRFGNLYEPEIPADFAPIVANVTGLNNLHAAVPMSREKPGLVRPRAPDAAPFAADAIARGFSLRSPVEVASLGAEPDLIVNGKGPALAPSDFDVFYDAKPLKDQGITGATGCIAIVGVSAFSTPAIQAFNNQFGLPDDSSSIVVSGSAGFGSAEVESELDLEWSHAVAPGAGLVFFAANDVITAMRNAVNSNACSVISISFGLCGGARNLYTSTIHGIAQQAAAQGQTILVAAGDTGAAGLAFDPNRGCVTNTKASVNELASDPAVTSIAGTSFDSSAFSGPNGSIVAHTTERVWDDANEGSVTGGATGGGVSIYFAKPSYQNGLGSGKKRNQPDVALIASPKFPGSFVYTGQNPVLGTIGGTSISTPMWAGIIKLLEQKAGGRLGAINSRIYQIARQGQSGAGFYDITTGNNRFNGVPGFSAAAGYDLASGWGTVDIDKFVTAYLEAPNTSTASIKLSRTSVNFGSTKVGKQKQKKVKLTNTSSKKSGDTVTFSGGAISGSPAFSLSTTCNAAVGPKQSCLAYVIFTPTSTGPQTATVTITSNAANGPSHTFTVNGNGK